MGLVTAMVITALPLAGDYYTNTLVSGSPNTTMVGNQIELFLLQGPLKNLGASLVLLLSLVLLFFMAYYLVLTQRASRESPDDRAPRLRARTAVATSSARRVPPWRNPWRRPYVLAGITWLYILWSLAPGAGRHPVLLQRRSVAQRLAGLLDAVVLLRRRIGRRGPEPAAGAGEQPDPRYGDGAGRDARSASCSRWASPAGARAPAALANGIALVPLVTPEIVVGSALYLVMVNLYQFVPLGRPAMLLGHVTFSISYVLVVVRVEAAEHRAGLRGGGARPRAPARCRRSGRSCCRC